MRERAIGLVCFRDAEPVAREVFAKYVFAPGHGPEWQAVQASFSKWTGGMPRCCGRGAPRLPSIGTWAPSTPTWHPAHVNDAAAGLPVSAASRAYPRIIR